MKPPLRLLRLPNTNSSPYICSNCLLSRASPTPSAPRFFSGTSRKLSTFAPPKPPSSGYTFLASRRLISLSGPDSTHYLQGVITTNLSPSTPRTTGFYCAFLNAQGRVLNDVFIYPNRSAEAEGWLIEVDAKEAERLAKHIKRYKLRAKFEVRVLEEGENGVWSQWDDGGHALSDETSTGGGEIGCLDTRAPGMGHRLILSSGKKPEVDMDESTEDAYRVRRYLKGVPEGQDELIRESALPQESNIDFMGGIDYRKGCYVGQELTIRTHHTGVIRKRVLPVTLYGMNDPMPTVLEYDPQKSAGFVNGEAIPAETGIGRFEKRGRSAGKWLRGVGNLGLGLCRLEIMTDVQVQGGSGGYQEGDEFKLEWEVEGGVEGTVKVKAFVPPWHLTKQ
jgi:folate-binding protein YgfZ